MNFEDRLARRRQLALIEAQSLVSLHRIGLPDLQQVEAELAARREALADRIREVRTLMAEHDITLEDLLDGGDADPGRITHRHPVTGETWNGLGTQPEWVRNALLVEGYRPSDLRLGETGNDGP